MHQWTGDAEAFGTEYSWIDYASQQGYPTFAYDRLGAGLSSFPDPILVVQLPTEAAVANQLVQMARDGTSPYFPRKFNKIIVVGHSMGSAVAQLFSVNYPTAADCIVLTGYSKYILNIVAGIFITAELLPADIVQPTRFSNLPVGYLTPNSYSGIEYLFWYDPYQNNTYYDQRFPPYDYARRQCLTVGEGATIALPLATSTMKGDVLLVTGQQDTLLCGTTALQDDGPGQCVGGPFNYLSTTGTLYPDARNFRWYNVPNSGHCWQFHFNAQLGFQWTHAQLANMGY
jgi:pimeloyl-ACP methyl ester carboxylesterase